MHIKKWSSKGTQMKLLTGNSFPLAAEFFSLLDVRIALFAFATQREHPALTFWRYWKGNRALLQIVLPINRLQVVEGFRRDNNWHSVDCRQPQKGGGNKRWSRLMNSTELIQQTDKGASTPCSTNRNSLWMFSTVHCCSAIHRNVQRSARPIHIAPFSCVCQQNMVICSSATMTKDDSVMALCEITAHGLSLSCNHVVTERNSQKERLHWWGSMWI